MNTSIKALLLAAAGTGLVAGAAPAPSAPSTFAGNTLASANPGQAPSMFAQTAKHACKGMNSCKGQGGCATGDMGCKGKNSCKGKGGCKTDM
jgi:hypothetical protein